MLRIALLALAVVVLSVVPGDAQTATYYLRKSASPVAIPGGTTSFVLDTAAPVATTPVAQSMSVPKGTTVVLPTFFIPTLAAPVTLGLDFDVVAHVSANLSMNKCAILGATIGHVDAGGTQTAIARGTLYFVSVPQGGAGGTTGFVAADVPVTVGCDRPTDDVTLQAGESLAVTLTITNGCKANRTVSVAYDATVAPGSASFSPTLPPDEVFLRACYAKCQQATSKTTAKFLGLKNRCVLRCQGDARKGLVPLNDCYPPYGGATSSCVADPLKGVEAKATASISKICTVSGRCPACYSGGDCTTHTADVVQTFEGAFDSFVPGIYCEPATTATGKCMDATAKSLWKFYASREKCFDKCFSNEAKGIVAPNACNPPATDPVVTACAELVATRARASIDKACFLSTGAVPACWSSITASQWVQLMGIASDGFIPGIYCAL